MSEERHIIEVRFNKDKQIIYEIAKELGHPYNTVKNEIARGTVQLYKNCLTQNLTASTPREPRAGFAFSLVATLLPQMHIRSICEPFVNYCNLLLQFAAIIFSINIKSYFNTIIARIWAIVNINFAVIIYFG